MLSTPVKIICGGEWLSRRWQLMLFFTGQDTADGNDTHGHFSHCARFHGTGENSLRASPPPPSTACSWLQAQAVLTDDPLGLPCLPSCPLPGLAPQTDVVRALLAHSPCTLCASARLQLLGAGGRVQDNIGQALAVTVPQSPGCPVGPSTYLLPRHGRSRPSPGYLTYLPTSRHLVCY